MSKTPKHIAIIMDGNGRWAEKQGKKRTDGHKQGAQTLEDIIQACKDLNIHTLTVFAFSSENWNRPKKEVTEIFRLAKEYFKKLTPKAVKNKLKVKIIGEKNSLDEDLLSVINNIENQTKDFTKNHLNIALNYGGQQEIINACRAIGEKIEKGILQADYINKEIFASHLYTQEQIDPDLIIRTSGEQRLSNFLLWQSAYSELYFTKKHWPEFTKKDLEKAINDFSQRSRRFGKEK